MLRCAAAVLVVLGGLPMPVVASTAKEASLETMVRLSGRILVGTCVAAQPSQIRIQGYYLPITRYRFRVSETLKGASETEFEFQQAGWPNSPLVPTRNAQNWVPFSIDGMPEYQVGQEYLLILTQPGSLGLCSPVGLQQSAFQAVRNRSGSRVWMNGVRNRNLLFGLTSLGQRSLEVSGLPAANGIESGAAYNEFIELVRRMAQEAR